MIGICFSDVKIGLGGVFEYKKRSDNLIFPSKSATGGFHVFGKNFGIIGDKAWSIIFFDEL